jgi:hypothetical protein
MPPRLPNGTPLTKLTFPNTDLFFNALKMRTNYFLNPLVPAEIFFWCPQDPQVTHHSLNSLFSTQICFLVSPKCPLSPHTHRFVFYCSN